MKTRATVVLYIVLSALDGAYAPHIRTDYGTYLEPPLPSLPAAGGKLIDPTFGTTIMRLTDGSDGRPDCYSQYSYWPSFNLDNTWVQASCISGGIERTRLFRFDPFSFTRGSGFFLTVPTPSGWTISPSDVIWSGLDPNILFGHPVNAQTINATNVALGTNALIKDLTSALPPYGRLQHMSKSVDDNVFAFHIIDSTGAVFGYLAWRRDIDKVVLQQRSTSVHEVHVDKTGRYLVVINANNSDRIWDLSAATFTDLGFNSRDQGFGHYDAGASGLLTQFWANAFNPGFDLGYRQLASPRTVTRLLTFPDASQDMHYSMLANDEHWATISTYNWDGNGGVAGPFQNELFQVATDGSGRVRRFAHHRSVVKVYTDSPRANITRDGRYVAFTSNWGNTNGRRDVFVVRLGSTRHFLPAANLTSPMTIRPDWPPW